MNTKHIKMRLAMGFLCLLATFGGQAVANDEPATPDKGVTMKAPAARAEEPVTELAVNINRRITQRPVTKSLAAVKGKDAQKRLTTEQAIAAAITQAAVLFETRYDRLSNASATQKRIVVRGNRLTMSYTQNLYERQCYLAIGPRLKWRTVNGYWAGRRVDTRALSYAIDWLRRNGITLDKITINVKTERDVSAAKRIARSLKIADTAIGLDPKEPVYAKVIFNRNQ